MDVFALIFGTYGQRKVPSIENLGHQGISSGKNSICVWKLWFTNTCMNRTNQVSSLVKIFGFNQVLFLLGTRGTETSQYPLEKKSTEILVVVASESRSMNFYQKFINIINRMLWKMQLNKVIALQINKFSLQVKRGKYIQFEQWKTTFKG